MEAVFAPSLSKTAPSNFPRVSVLPAVGFEPLSSRKDARSPPLRTNVSPVRASRSSTGCAMTFTSPTMSTQTRPEMTLCTCIAALDHEYRSRVRGSSKCSPPFTFTCTYRP